MKIHRLLILLSLLLSGNCSADELALRVVGLFKNAALVEHAGQQKLYRTGQFISAEIKLIRADSLSATFLIEGKNVELKLDKSGGYHTPAVANADAVRPKQANILRTNGGMYKTAGFINGFAVSFLVDTGASQVAMNERIAKLVGLNYKLNGDKVGVSTAAGVVPAWRATLKKVRVGEIELSNVDALIVKGVGPGEVLLGMSFLNRVTMEDNGQILKLVKKF